MSQDRAHADTFHVTPEFLAYMLDVRRVGTFEDFQDVASREDVKELGDVRARRKFGALVFVERRIGDRSSSEEREEVPLHVVGT